MINDFDIMLLTVNICINIRVRCNVHYQFNKLTMIYNVGT